MIAAALVMDTTELFSVKPLPEDAISNLHKAVLRDFEQVISRRLKKL